MSGAHITHATAVFCEITLAISIGVVTKIIKTAPITDKLARETTINRIKESEGSHLAWIFRGLCKISDFLNKAKSLIPYIALLGSLSVLFGLAFCPKRCATWGASAYRSKWFDLCTGRISVRFGNYQKAQSVIWNFFTDYFFIWNHYLGGLAR